MEEEGRIIKGDDVIHVELDASLEDLYMHGRITEGEIMLKIHVYSIISFPKE